MGAEVAVSRTKSIQKVSSQSVEVPKRCSVKIVPAFELGNRRLIQCVITLTSHVEVRLRVQHVFALGTYYRFYVSIIMSFSIVNDEIKTDVVRCVR